MDELSPKSNKQMMYIGAGVVALIIIAALGFFVLSNKTSTTQSTTATDTQSDQKPVMEGKSVKELMSFSGSQQCKYDDVSSGTSGSVYVGGGKMRGDFTSSGASTTVSSHMISDGQYSYVWTEGQANGVKMSIADIEKNQTSSEGAPKTVDVDQKLDYNCSAWVVDAGKFTVPADIKFSDISEMMKGVTTQGSQKPAGVDSSACNSISDAAAKASCLKALGQ